MESALEEERDNFKKTAKNLEKAESQLQAAQMELHELQATVSRFAQQLTQGIHLIYRLISRSLKLN